MPQTQELFPLLVRTFELLRVHQEVAFKATLAATAAVEALKETNPEFAEAYDRHFWELKQGALGAENNTAIRMIDELKQQLRNLELPPGASA